MITLYGAPLSSYVRKVTICLSHKQLEFEHIAVIPAVMAGAVANAPDDWDDISPLGKIPVLRDGHVAIADSSVIFAYLEEQYPQNALLPKEPALRARCRWFEEYADTTMSESILLMLFRERVLLSIILKQEADQAVIKKSTDKLIPQIFDYLSKQLGDNDYFVGNNFSVADVSIVSLFITLHISMETIDAKRWQNLSNFYQRIATMPIIKPIVEKDQKILASYQNS